MDLYDRAVQANHFDLDAKQSAFPASFRTACPDLVPAYRGACHRARVRATRWLMRATGCADQNRLTPRIGSLPLEHASHHRLETMLPEVYEKWDAMPATPGGWS